MKIQTLPLTLLIVSPDEKLRLLLKTYLQKSFTLLEANAVHEAIRIAASCENLDIIFSDFILRDGDALDVALGCREYFLETPFVVITGRNTEAGPAKERLYITFDLPDVECLEMPFCREELEACVESALRTLVRKTPKAAGT